MDPKTVNSTSIADAKKNVSDIEVFGDGDTFKLICKASSKSQGWMKSTKAMEILGYGCVLQVSTQQINDTGSRKVLGYEKNIPQYADETVKQSVVAEAVTFIPGVKIQEFTEDGKVVKRTLVKIEVPAQIIPQDASVDAKPSTQTNADTHEADHQG